MTPDAGRVFYLKIRKEPRQDPLKGEDCPLYACCPQRYKAGVILGRYEAVLVDVPFPKPDTQVNALRENYDVVGRWTRFDKQGNMCLQNKKGKATVL